MLNWFVSLGYILLIFIPRILSVNSRDPCDPIRDATVAEVFPSDEMRLLASYNKNITNWTQTTMKYINCSARGLKFVPSSIPDHVQLIDLSLNLIVHFEKYIFSRFTQLVAMSLSWNCPKNRYYTIPYCNVGSTLLHEEAFDGIRNLKMLNLSNNIFKKFPVGLPHSIQHIDISSTAITSLSFNDVSIFNNLVTVVAKALCVLGNPDVCSASKQITIATNVFSESNYTLKVLTLSFNNFYRQSVSTFGYANLLVLNLDETRISIPNKLNFSKLTNLKHLSLNNLFPYDDIHVKFPNKTFDLLTKLEFLDLSNNMMNNIPVELFKFNQNLQFLEISGNCLFPVLQDPIFLKLILASLTVNQVTAFCGWDQLFLP